MRKVKFPASKIKGVYRYPDPAHVRSDDPEVKNLLFGKTEIVSTTMYAEYYGELDNSVIDDDDRASDLIIPITDVVFSGPGHDEDQPDGRVDVLVDSPITMAFNIGLTNGTKVTIPVRNVDTGQLKVIRGIVSNGTVSRSFKFESSGMWETTVKDINYMGRVGVTFVMDNDINLLVQES